MKLIIEELEEKQKILIISTRKYPFLDILKNNLKKLNSEIYFSSLIPKSIQDFDYCFVINEKVNFKNLNYSKKNHIVHIFLKKSRFSPQSPFVGKIVICTGDFIREHEIERILWFSFSKSDEKQLLINNPSLTKKHIPPALIFPWKISLSFKSLIILVISLTMLFHVLFILPLIMASFYSYQAYNSLKKEDYQSTEILLSQSFRAYYLARLLYMKVRPTYLLFSIALFPDTTIDILDKGLQTFQQSLSAKKNGEYILKLLLKKGKTETEINETKLRMQNIQKQLASIEDNLTGLVQKLPLQFNLTTNTKKQLLETIDGLHRLNKLFPHITGILQNPDEQKFLLFFANNMELRPGGGFLGSFGILRIWNYTVEDIEIHDVYDADGQLTAHIEPPMAVKKYLNQPHLFLRDSNFSADFSENYEKAKFLLDKEIRLRDFNGAILLTTNAVQNILAAFGNIYLPDFKETINKDNFYIKTQLRTENDFFPGSIQKKSFLGTLARQIIIQLEQASFQKIAKNVKKSLDEKQMVIFFEETNLQKLVDSFYWSGRVIQPKCSYQIGSCNIDYLFPYDANVGANKVNFYIQKSINDLINISADGNISHKLTIMYKNESYDKVFPGGTYKNYFQILLPKNSAIKQVTKNGVTIDEFIETNNEYKQLGFYFEVEAQKTAEIQIQYQLKTDLSKGKSLFQYVVQKQIGSSSPNFSMEIVLPQNFTIVNQNFSPLVKDNRMLYNTSLSTDKIFFIEIIRN
ncbi:MAG: hypothetical protein US11_C0001G0046 [Candidatus Roizmanbacteria bacterium GW2011_GWA2_36_23]|uniref:Tetratricopeptide TPR_2 repeat protein n=1 Tax=Candidatus Roizmanbacteria bacterium GW2011_GWA2_36_23 TaxID=1618480 RepID=A0A0G0E9C3_9BACT|nr:MAG: hypothetical protein US11_C0001G0046 [Candidatus Roizmanbacteria bacterium GW2011_GWA2_36_23]